MKKIIVVMFFVLLTVFGCSQFESEIKEIMPEEVKEISKTEKEVVEIERVIDGDTVEVKLSNGDIETIRLLLIDTPESVHPEKKNNHTEKNLATLLKKY